MIYVYDLKISHPGAKHEFVTILEPLIVMISIGQLSTIKQHCNNSGSAGSADLGLVQ